MTRKEVYAEVTETFGFVPGFIKSLSDVCIGSDWENFKASQLAEGAIPPKYRELIGVAISAIIRCKYCSYFHSEVAKLNGATPEEIEDAVHFAKSSAGWSTYINGTQYDYEEFKKEVDSACDHIRNQMTAEG